MTNDAKDNSRGPSVLEDVLTVEQIAHLKDHWIETPEQFLSSLVTEEGKAGMCRLLGLDETQLAKCASRLARGLPPELLEKLQSNQSGGELGVILPTRPTDRGNGEGEEKE